MNPFRASPVVYPSPVELRLLAGRWRARRKIENRLLVLCGVLFVLAVLRVSGVMSVGTGKGRGCEPAGIEVPAGARL